MERSNLIVLTAVIFAMTAAPAVYASYNYSMFPGSMCQPYNETTDTYTIYQTDPSYWGGGMVNDSAWQMDYVCPIVIDQIETIDYLGSTSDNNKRCYVKMIDQSNNVGTGGQVRCRIVSHDADLKNAYSWTAEVSSSDTGYSTTQTYDRIFGYLAVYDAHAFAYMRCFIPPEDIGQSGVMAYRIVEQY